MSDDKGPVSLWTARLHAAATISILAACGPQVCDTPQCETAYEVCAMWADAQCRHVGVWGALDEVWPDDDDDDEGKACQAGLRDGWKDAGCSLRRR